MVANFFLQCLLRSVLVNFDCCFNCHHKKIVVTLAPLKLIIIHALRNCKGAKRWSLAVYIKESISSDYCLTLLVLLY